MKIINHFIIFFFQFKILHSFQNIINIQKYKSIIKKKYSSHLHIGYTKSRKILFNNINYNLIYINQINNIYNKIKINNLNCEHVWCQKYFNYKEPMKSDLHIMFLCYSKINSHRKDYKFSEIKNNYITLNDEGYILNNNYNISISNNINKIFNNNFNTKYNKKNNNQKIFEPHDHSKGKVSRSIAYYSSIYNDTYIDEIIDNKCLIEWNRKYLPRLNEIRRNEIIRLEQKNINPYIKYPVLIELLYNNKINTYYIIKLSIYSIFCILLSDIFRFNYFIKKILF